MEFVLLNHINNIFPLRTHILIAISGGLDSMVLLEILQKTKLYISVIHVNFQLRNNNSKKDEFFIREFCFFQKILFYKKYFNTKRYSIEKKQSIQIAARNLRYSFFFKLLKTIDASYITLGHHLDDAIETFFINLYRSSSLRGLISIPEISKYLIRPLLPFNKIKILQFAKINNLWWREDISNISYRYLRNSIRNDLITNIYNKKYKTIYFLKYDDIIIQQSINNIFKLLTIIYVKHPFCWELNISKLRKLNPLNVYLYRIFHPYGFLKRIKIDKFLYLSTGKSIDSKNYRLVHTKNSLIVFYKTGIYKIYKINLNFFFEVNDYMAQKALISLDYEIISFPIFLRNWKQNDSLFLKKYSLNKFEKKEIYIILNADNKIIWIINFVINLFFKISLKTKIILNIF